MSQQVATVSNLDKQWFLLGAVLLKLHGKCFFLVNHFLNAPALFVKAQLEPCNEVLTLTVDARQVLMGYTQATHKKITKAMKKNCQFLVAVRVP